MRLALALLLALPYYTLAADKSHADKTHWVATWGASPAPPLATEEQLRAAHLLFENQTLRLIVHSSIGGHSVRIRLSNAYGAQTVAIGAAHIALHAHGPDTVPGSDRALTFSGRATAFLPPNALLLSDPVPLDVPASADLAISLFLPKSATAAGIHYSAEQTSYIAPGDATATASLPDTAPLASWVFLSGVDVLASPAAATLVAFGDSITDGAQSTSDANRRWPNLLADRLLAHRQTTGVLNAGIGGNRILHDPIGNPGFGVNALARFDRDVLAQPGVKYVIVLEGINDLGHPGTSAPASETVSAPDIIAGLTQLIERAHEKGITVVGGTLTPFEGTTFPGYFTLEKEIARQAINQWIRSSRAFDGVIDFDKAAQDPNHPARLLPAYDSGDHLHPNDAGYKAMADSIPLSLFK